MAIIRQLLTAACCAIALPAWAILVPAWTQQQELTPSDGMGGDLFGLSVAVSGDTAIVGVPYMTIGSHADQGAVYVFVRSGGAWT
jgi:hypothetical protein